jgi:DNA polymerase-1
MIALIDTDLLAFRCAASAEGEEESIALSRLEDLMERTLFNVNASEYKAFLTGKDNFRKKIYPLYKANRTAPRPIHLEACRNYLVNEWQAEVVTRIEADDILGMEQTLSASPTVIVSIDKDLRQIPGQHFNFVKLDWSEVDEYTGWFNFYRQFLEGDASDNIRGVDGIGPKKAEKLLYGRTPEEMFQIIRELYENDERMLMNGRCLYIMRKEKDIWNPPELTLEGPLLFDKIYETQTSDG